MASQQLVDEIIFKLRVYRDGQKVRADVLDAIRNFPSLQPRSGVLGMTLIVVISFNIFANYYPNNLILQVLIFL